ncbi:hypothetical protein JCM6882_001739 [Rhodosporidiobolus microsporus]
MQPPRRARPAAPLLSFPPDPPQPPLPRREEQRPRSTLFRFVAFLPLVFILALLGFAAYAFLWSLCIDYLLLQRHSYTKAVLYSIAFSFLLFGCGGNVWMAYWRGGGVVPGAGGWKRRDEEEELEAPGAAKGEVGRFVLGEEGEEEEEQVDEERENEAREEEALLEGDAERDGSPARRGGGRAQMLQVKSDGTRRFCRKCNTFKPDRAHHCSSCRRCVLKMDHHCPWLGGGCVGWANYKFFLLFLLYSGAFGIFLGATLFHELVNFVDDVDNGFELAPISWALAALLGVIFGSAVGLFGLYHLYLASKNRTTIEAMEHPTTISPISPAPPSSTHPSPSDPSAAAQALHSSSPRPALQLSYKQRHRLARAAREYNIYDLGWRENLRQVFANGEREEAGTGKKGGGLRKWVRRVEWVMPWGWPPGDGQSFPINTHHLASLRRVTDEIYAEAARGGSGGGGTRVAYEDDGYDTANSAESDEDGPLRRA